VVDTDYFASVVMGSSDGAIGRDPA